MGRSVAEKYLNSHAYADIDSPKSDKGIRDRYVRYKRTLENLTMMSDALMRIVLKKQDCTEYILRIIMGIDDLLVIEQTIQKDYKNLQGRSAILDCVARDGEGRQYNVEIQQDNEGASPKRARYHSGLMDMNTLDAGQDFDELPESYVIFITRGDPLGRGIPAYHIGRKIYETQDDFKDGTHIIYVNSKIQDDTKLGHLMHDLNCKDADAMYSGILAARIRALKETQEGVDFMCSEMDKIYSEGILAGEKQGIEIGEKQGTLRAKRKMAASLGSMGIPVEQIAQAADENINLVKQWISESGVKAH